MSEFLFSVLIGIILGLLFFVSAKHYAHKRYEISWLWMLFLSAVSWIFGFVQIPKPYVFLSCAALVVSIIVIRKIIIHQRNVNRHPYAQRYGQWLIYFWLFFSVIFTLWIFF